MATALLIMLREGFEAALVVAIVFAYLRRIERLDLSRAVWQGVGVAVGISLAVGVIVHITIGNLEGAARLRSFAAISFLALCVLTWMVFWMRRQARAIKGELEHRVDAALMGENVARNLAAVALLAVLREGIEAALFLIAAATEDSGWSVLIGGFIGLALASTAAWLVYYGGRSLPMKAFFTVTGVVLIVFAAGLASRTVLFLQGAGDLGSFSLNGVYDLRQYVYLTQSTEVGKFLAAMFGWDPRPSIEQVVVYLGYLVPVLYLFLRPQARPAPDRAQPRATAAA
ncbi:MAG: iron permease [Acidimicrobiales bacterium]|jgi:high-affinity iron transporter|nr:iron permease [Acidimicrobiales bacterium]